MHHLAGVNHCTQQKGGTTTTQQVAGAKTSFESRFLWRSLKTASSPFPKSTKSKPAAAQTSAAPAAPAVGPSLVFWDVIERRGPQGSQQLMFSKGMDEL